MNGQWPPSQMPRIPENPDRSAHMDGMMMGNMRGGGGAQGPISPARGGSGQGTAEVLPSSEALEVEAMKRGMPPLEQCLRRCPRCLQGVPIRSMMCSHCQYVIPASAKAMARREMKEAAMHGGGQHAAVMNGGYGSTGSPTAGGEGGYRNYLSPRAGGGIRGGRGGGSDSDEPRPRQKRRRQSTKKGNMTATEEELAELDEGLEDEEPVSWRKSSAQRRTGRVQTDKRKKKCPSCNEMNPMSVKVCRECDTVFPVGARLDSAVTSEELREKFSFEPEFNKDGTPMIEKILGRRPIEEPDPDDEGAMAVLKKLHRPAHHGHHYECLVKFKGVSYAKVEWMSELDIRSLGMVASRMLTNYLKTKEREEAEGGRVEEEDYFDQSYLEVEKVLDAKVFKMEREIYPDGFDPNAPMDPDEEPEATDDDDEPEMPHQERARVPEWEDEGVEPLPGKRTREDPEWRPMTRCRHVLATIMEDDLSAVFHEPVDVYAYPSYAEKVDEPMDLGTIKSKLNNWEYRRNDPLGFTRDMRLVFSNCKVFNKFGSTIWYIADYLQAKFERLFQAWVLNFGDKDDRIPWEEPRARPWEEWCRKCMGPETKRNKMLLCDTCDAEYHCKCLGLDGVPKGQWLCPICEIMLHKGQTLFSHQTEVEKAKRSQMPQPEIEVIEVQKYLVKWCGLSYQFCTWEDREELNNDDKIEQFKSLNEHPPISPPMSEEELSRTLSQTNHDVLPALMEPSSVLEHNAQIYSQIRAFHFLRHGMCPPTGLLKECGKPAALFAEAKEAGASRPEGEAADKDLEDIQSLLFDMKSAISHGNKYEAPPRTDMPLLRMHQYEYEVTLPKENGSLFMNIHQQTVDGIVSVFISSLTQRTPPRHLEPTPVMRTHQVAVGDLITAINGLPVMGCDTLIVANVLQALPACVTLRLTKYAAQCFSELVNIQRQYTASLAAWDARKMQEEHEKRVNGQALPKARWQDRIERVDDHFTLTATSVDAEEEHRVIEELGQKRRLLMAVNESKDKPLYIDWTNVALVYSLADYVYAHENMGHVESMASRRHDPRAKPIEQLDPETGEVIKVWPSMTAASVALLIGVSALSACVNGISAQAGRWKWRFASKLTASALKMGVYRKNRVADLSAGPGAYLEGGMAALIAAGVGRSEDRPSSGGGNGEVTVKPDSAAGTVEEETQKKSSPGVHGSTTTPESQRAAKQERSEQTVAKDEASSTTMDVDSRGDTGASEGAGGAASAGTDSASGTTTSDTSAGKYDERMPKSEGREEEGDGAGEAGESARLKMDGRGAGGGGGGEGNVGGGTSESGKKYGDSGGGTVENEEAAVRRRQLLQQAQKMREQQQQLKEEREREEARRLARLKNGEQADEEHSEDEEDGYDEEGEEYDGAAGGPAGAGVGIGMMLPYDPTVGAGGGRQPHPKYDFESMGAGYTSYNPATGMGGESITGDGNTYDDDEEEDDGGGDRSRKKARRGRKGSFEDSDPDPARAGSSEEEEEEVDWDDSAEEDADAATAEAIEEARIGMARAAARDLRESRATRAQMMEWPYRDGTAPEFKNTNELRDYQRRGVNWMLSCWKLKKRGCVLADEMGLGKTVQVVAMLNYVFSNSEREKGPFLVVVPLTTIEHWRREVEAWTDMNLCVYHDNGGRDMRDLIREYEWYYSGRSKRVLKFHVLVTTYDDVISDAEMLAQVPWRAVVVDEAHRMRNKNSALLGCLQQVVHNGTTVHAYQHRVLMTGTPMQNIKEELWPLMNFIDSANFPDLQRFQEKYCKGEPGHEVEEAKALRRRLKPYMLRRRKEDVTKDIPPKEETIIDVELTMVQKKYYRAIYERNHSVLNKVGAGAGKAPSLMNIQMELRKCCNHPFMVRGVEDHEVDNIVLNLMEEAQHEDSDDPDSKMTPQRLNTLRLEKGLIHTSGKMVLLDKLLPKLKSEGHKVLIFSQFIGMLDMIQEFLSLRGHRHERLDGRTTGNERQKSIDRFNREPTSFVFLLSTRAGGVGINLTAADTCIIYDSDWNPQNDVQAMARCHRIGQTKSVMVYRLITRDCFESEMFNRASMKLGLEQAVLGDAAGTLKPRDMEDLLKKGAYALTQMDDNNAMSEFQEMDIDSILERKSRVLVEEPTAKGLADDSDHEDESDTEQPEVVPQRGDQHRVTWRSFGGGSKSGPSLEDPDFWRKVMPDVMTPESMVTKLDSFENLKDGDPGPNQADLDQFMKDLGLMVVGLRKSRDEDEREKGVQLLVRVGCKRELFGDDQCDKARKWEMELQGTRLRQATRQDHGDINSPEKNRTKSGRKSSSGGGSIRRTSGLLNEEADSKAKISLSGATGTSGKAGGTGKSSGRDHNMDMCARCEDGGVIMCCDGPCQRSFHPVCLGMDDKPDEDPWLCNRCSSHRQKCLQCGEKGPEMESHSRAKKKPGGVSKCQLSSCGRFYHKECLQSMEPDHSAYSKEGNFKCPQHFCFDCGKTSTNLGPRTLSKCLRCAKARCPDCLMTARYVKKGKWMVCSDHEWKPQDLALYEEQQRQKRFAGSEKGKRKPKTPPQPSLQFSEEQEAKLLDGRAPVCYFCKGDVDDPETVEGAFIRPPFVQKTIKHGELPIWLHTNCMLYTPECFIEYPPGFESPHGASSTLPSSPNKSSGTPLRSSGGSRASAGNNTLSTPGGQKSSSSGLSRPTYYGVDEARKRVALKCTSCGLQGALIGCHVSSCQTNTHYSCAMREGWLFGDQPDAEGKLFLCLMHRAQGQVRFEKKASIKKSSKKPAPKNGGEGDDDEEIISTTTTNSNNVGSSNASSNTNSKGKGSSKKKGAGRDRSGSASGTTPDPYEMEGASTSKGGSGGGGKAKRVRRPKDSVKREGESRKESGVRQAAVAAEDMDVDCPCGMERETQGYLHCNSCQAWLHYECAGTTADSPADADSFTCRDCSSSSSKKSSKRKVISSSSFAAADDQQQHHHQHNREDGDVQTPNRKRSKTSNPGKLKASKGGGVAGNLGGGSSGKSGKATPKKVGGGSVGGGVGVGGAAVGWQGGAARGDPAPWAKLEAGWRKLEPHQIRIAVNGALSLLSKEDPSGYFSDPVDIALVPGYRDVVSRPLDFSTIKKRQKKGRYSKLGVSRLWEDIATVYQNAKLYNQDESDCFKKAKRGLDVMHSKIEHAITKAAAVQRSNTSSSANGAPSQNTTTTTNNNNNNSNNSNPKKSSSLKGGGGGAGGLKTSTGKGNKSAHPPSDQGEEGMDRYDNRSDSDRHYRAKAVRASAPPTASGRKKRAAAVAAAAALAEGDSDEAKEEEEGEDESDDSVATPPPAPRVSSAQSKQRKRR